MQSSDPMNTNRVRHSKWDQSENQDGIQKKLHRQEDVKWRRYASYRGRSQGRIQRLRNVRLKQDLS